MTEGAGPTWKHQFGVIRQRNGMEVHVTLFREAGRPLCLSIWLNHPASDGTMLPDRHRGIRFHVDEIDALVRAVMAAQEEAARLEEGDRRA